MNRNFYSFAILIGVLFTIVSFLNSIIYFQLGVQIYSLESFVLWYVCVHVISLIGTLILLRYYHFRKYELAFWTAIISTVASLFQFFIVYSLMMGERELANYYIPVVLMVLATGMLYSLTLIFSNAAKKPWLKAAGVFTLFIGLVLVATFIWSVFPPDARKNAMAEKIHRWSSLINSLVPVLFIMNFLNERKAFNKENVEPPPQRSLESIWVSVSFMATIATVILGSLVASESASKISWENHLVNKAKEWTKIFETRSFTGTEGDTLQYQLLKPLDFDPQKSYPLVVCLPYGGGVEGSPAAQVLLDDSYRKKYPAFLFVPYCPSGAGWGGIPNYPTIDTLVFESMYALEEEYKQIDVKRRYVTGVSRGGYGSWHFICTRPEMFAAAIPVCGGGDPRLGKNIVDVSVWAFHGEKDRNVPVSGSRGMIQAIKNAGGDPQYTEFPNAGHNIWDQVKATPGLLDWLFTQQRD